MNSIKYITLHLTNACNLYCRHCWVEASTNSNKGVIPIEKLKQIIDEAEKMQILSVKLTGGEPFMYSDIRELIRYIYVKKISISIETNATLFKEDDIDLIKECNCYIATSLDGFSSNYHDWFRQSSGCFDKTLKNIRKFIERDIPFQVIWSVCKENENDIERMVDFCNEEKIKTIKINPVNLAGRMHNSNEITILNATERIALHKKILMLRNKHPDMHIAYPLPPAFMSVGEYKCFSSECDLCSRCAILCNGDVGLCGASITKSTTIYGNIYNEELSSIVNNERIKEKCDDILDNIEGVCNNCIHKCHCKGYCRANALFVSDNIKAPYFLCQEMYESGLFPTSRLKR